MGETFEGLVQKTMSELLEEMNKELEKLRLEGRRQRAVMRKTQAQRQEILSHSTFEWEVTPTEEFECTECGDGDAKRKQKHEKATGRFMYYQKCSCSNRNWSATMRIPRGGSASVEGSG